MKTLLRGIAILIFALSSGCSTQIYQVVEVSPVNGVVDNDFIVFENDSVSVAYNFWSEKGKFIFSIRNKLNIPIFLDWRISSFVYNDQRFVYYDNQTTVSTTTKGSSSGYNWGNYFKQLYLWGKNNAKYSESFSEYMGFSVTNWNSESVSVITKPEETTFLPPKSYLRKSYFTVQSELLPANHDSLKKVGRGGYVYIRKYDNSNSPVRMRNFISYSTDKSFQRFQYVDNEMFVKRVFNIPNWYFEVYNSKDNDGNSIYTYPYAKPNRFYMSFYY